MMHERIYKDDPLPTYEEIRAFIGKKGVKVFNKLITHLNNNYNFQPEIYYGGKNYGVLIRYRRSSKTLVSIFPEKDGISIVLVYGKNEIKIFKERRKEFSGYLCKIFNTTKQYHDGRWLLIPMEDEKYLNEVIEMIAIKKKPNKK